MKELHFNFFKIKKSVPDKKTASEKRKREREEMERE